MYMKLLKLNKLEKTLQHSSRKPQEPFVSLLSFHVGEGSLTSFQLSDNLHQSSSDALLIVGRTFDNFRLEALIDGTRRLVGATRVQEALDSLQKIVKYLKLG